ncbi:LysR family transcriptional regulator [Pseudomaricurvus alkylphenolicus]|jgi:DNA-binding transcriptional LysR family regulator|uniref:LysR family transcriptional regulator n=1 Tax=Pseudomaricurvus alkylphenolicus TaxID=1306991 RepID=UPI001421D949|nr:LysR family transcriptional regulator [Pseudomaricurvus alkylphenolicus]NIB38792.1 LysR family transcriptional regulator [Pseudomaricurvus alkylphenolicus]
MKSRLHAHVGTLRQLEILLAVHDQGSINRAAKALYLTQPTVSMQMKKLSEAIGMPLYNISHRQLVFTDEGLELVKTAVEVLDSFDRLDRSLNSMRELQSGTLRLAVVNTSQYFIPHLLGPFCERYPGIDIQLKVGNRQQTVERLKQGVEDFFVFSHPPQDMDTETIEFVDNPLVAIAPEDHPLAKRKRLKITDLLDEPFLMREQGSGTRHAIEEFMRRHKVQLNIKMTIDSNEAIKHSVMSKLGISILSAHTLTYGGQSGLVKLPVKELPIDSHWFFVWAKSKRRTVIASEFLSYVEEEGKDVLQAELAKHLNSPKA